MNEGRAAHRTTGASVLHGAKWNLASLLVPQLYLLATSIAAARFLGPDAMGRQSFIAFVEISVVMAFTGGMPFALARFVGETLGAEQPGGVRELMRWAWRIEVPAAVLGLGVLLIWALGGAEPRAAWALAGVAAASGILQTVPAALLTGMQRWRARAVVGLVIGGLSTAAVIVVLAAGGGIVGMFVVELVASVASLAATQVLARRALGSMQWSAHGDPVSGRAHDDERTVLLQRATRYAAVATMTSLLSLIVWRRSEFFVLDRYSPDSEIALYSIAFAAAAALVGLPQAVGGAVAPAFATLFGAGQHGRIASGYGRALRLMLLVGLPTTAAAFALGPRAISVVYGEDYAGAGTVLRVMVATFPLVCLTSVSRSLLAGLAMQRVVLLAGLAAAAVDIALALLLVPRFDALGAAVASAAAQTTISAPVVVAASRAAQVADWRADVIVRTVAASAALATAATGALALSEGILGLAIGAAAGLIAFAVPAAVLGVLAVEDAAWLSEVTSGRLAGVAGRLTMRPRSAAA